MLEFWKMLGTQEDALMQFVSEASIAALFGTFVAAAISLVKVFRDRNASIGEHGRIEAGVEKLSERQEINAGTIVEKSNQLISDIGKASTLIGVIHEDQRQQADNDANAYRNLSDEQKDLAKQVEIVHTVLNGFHQLQVEYAQLKSEQTLLLVEQTQLRQTIDGLERTVTEQRETIHDLKDTIRDREKTIEDQKRYIHRMETPRVDRDLTR